MVEADEAVIVALRMSKAGYGRPDEILAMPADLVMQAVEYEGFLRDYEEEAVEMNRPEAR